MTGVRRGGKGNRGASEVREDRTREDRGRGRLQGRYCFLYSALYLTMQTHSSVECLFVKTIQSESHRFFRDKICRRQWVLVFLPFVVLHEKINFKI